MGHITHASSVPDGKIQAAVDALSDLAELPGIDMGQTIVGILAAAAANAGSVEDLLDDDPAVSRMTPRIADLINAGCPGDRLLTRRNRPVVLQLDVASIFTSVGIAGRFDADFQAVKSGLTRGTRTVEGYPTAELLAAMNGIYEADQVGYMHDYADAARAHLRGLGLPDTVPVELRSYRPEGPVFVWDDLEVEAHVAAAAATADHLDRLAQGPGYRTQAMRVLSGLPATTTRTEVA